MSWRGSCRVITQPLPQSTAAWLRQQTRSELEAAAAERHQAGGLSSLHSHICLSLSHRIARARRLRKSLGRKAETPLASLRLCFLHGDRGMAMKKGFSNRHTFGLLEFVVLRCWRCLVAALAPFERALFLTDRFSCRCFFFFVSFPLHTTIHPRTPAPPTASHQLTLPLAPSTHRAPPFTPRLRFPFSFALSRHVSLQRCCQLQRGRQEGTKTSIHRVLSCACSCGTCAAVVSFADRASVCCCCCFL